MHYWLGVTATSYSVCALDICYLSVHLRAFASCSDALVLVGTALSRGSCLAHMLARPSLSRKEQDGIETGDSTCLFKAVEVIFLCYPNKDYTRGLGLN